METKYLRLGSVCSKIGSGATPIGGKEAYQGGGYKLIRSQNVVDLRFAYEGLAEINEKQATKLNNVKVEEKDVLLNITGDSVARCCLAPIGILPARVNQHVAIIRPKAEILNPYYLLFWLIVNKQYLLALAAAGATRNGLTKAMISGLVIECPSLEKQNRIASILSTYDSLIENNTKRIRLLEKMAENLYKEWFVRFRFPGHENVEMENGLPKGWKRSSLSDVCVFKRGKNITSSEMEEGNVPVISAGLEPSGYHSCSNVKGTNVTMSSSGANAGYIAIHYSDIWAADCSYIEESTTGNIYYVYELLNNIRTVINNFQRGAAQPHVYPKDVNRIKLILPSENLMQKANARLEMMHKEIHNLQHQNSLLARQRDLLLPRLMSGKLEVKVKA